jgi:urea transport system permease protein
MGLVLALLAMIAPTTASAADFATSVARLGADSFTETEAAVGDVATSGNERAVVVIEALSGGTLLFDPGTHRVVIKEPDGTITDAATGEAVAAADASSSKPVRLNNRIRRSLEASLGTLRLIAPDPAKRREAAAAVFKSRDAANLPALDTALAKESDPGVKQALLEARAAIVLAQVEAAEGARVAAVGVIAARGDQDAIALLSALPDDAPDAVKKAAAAASDRVRRSLVIWDAVQNVWYGLSLGSVLLLAAIGLAITFGVMGVINMAHGEMVMIGAYVTFVVQEIIRTRSPGLFDWSLAIALPLAFLIAGGIGVLVERGVIRFLYGRPLETLLATWGISLILQQGVRTAFGPTNREVGAPSWMSGSFTIGHLAITWSRLWIIVFALAVFVGLLLLLRATRFGLEMRAVTQNRRMASAMGIRTDWVDALTFGLGSAIAGVAGVALSQIDNVSPNLGQSYIIDSFLVVVFGGVGSLLGTLVGAMTLGVANKILEPYAGAVLGKILLLVFIVLFIQKRPRGLFALKGRAVES